MGGGLLRNAGKLQFRYPPYRTNEKPDSMKDHLGRCPNKKKNLLKLLLLNNNFIVSRNFFCRFFFFFDVAVFFDNILCLFFTYSILFYINNIIYLSLCNKCYDLECSRMTTNEFINLTHSYKSTWKCSVCCGSRREGGDNSNSSHGASYYF